MVSVDFVVLEGGLDDENQQSAQHGTSQHVSVGSESSPPPVTLPQSQQDLGHTGLAGP